MGHHSVYYCYRMGKECIPVCFHFLPFRYWNSAVIFFLLTRAMSTFLPFILFPLSSSSIIFPTSRFRQGYSLAFCILPWFAKHWTTLLKVLCHLSKWLTSLQQLQQCLLMEIAWPCQQPKQMIGRGQQTTRLIKTARCRKWRYEYKWLLNYVYLILYLLEGTVMHEPNRSAMTM